ncbi:hypothetical protein ACFWN2_04695 [Lentzea sp. NPDC058436]|uniref:hypothetical protein n=1 Tax=Lentzea sp. NPDC058436 TaxID=3346499 RepID=UPI00365767C4
MASAAETLQATLSEAAYKVLGVLAHSTDPLSGRKVTAALNVAPGTANDALSILAAAGHVTSARSGRATLWQLEASHPAISAWLQETLTEEATTGAGASPYSTGGGGTRLEHSYAACLIASFLVGEALTELGDSVAVDTIRLQASDSSDGDDILVVGRDHHGQTHHASIAVRRSPALTASDSTSIPLIRDFLAIVTGHWPAVSAGRWRTVLAVSTNSNAIIQLGALARSLLGADALARRLSEPGRTNSDLRVRHEHLVALVAQASACACRKVRPCRSRASVCGRWSSGMMVPRAGPLCLPCHDPRLRRAAATATD